MRSLTAKLRRALGVAMGVGGLVSVSAGAASPVYENRGVANNPNIDATVLLNRGTLNINTSDQPFDTTGTLYTTNFVGGVIAGSGGFKFDFVNTNGLRYPASSFYNGGTVKFDAGNGASFLAGGFIGDIASKSWILVNATNIQNRGGLSVDPSGLIQLKGGNINLSRAGVRAGYDPSDPVPPGSSFGTFYSNERGITDNYGGVGQNNQLDPGAGGGWNLNALTGPAARSGGHQVLVTPNFTNTVVVPRFGSLTNVMAHTNALSPTNWVIQAVYFNTNTTDPSLSMNVRFGTPNQGTLDGAVMPIVQFALVDVDTITADAYTNFVYIMDTLGSMTNSILQTNTITAFTGLEQQKPDSFVITRTTPPEWNSPIPTNIEYKADLIYNPNYGSQTVTNWYSAYSFNAGESSSTVSLQNFIFGGSFGGGGKIPAFDHPTNKPGRVEIEADRLDLSLSRFRTEGLLSIKTKNLIGAPPYKLDASVVNMSVGLESGSLMVSNVIQPTVRRFNGVVNLYSSIWTNTTFTTADDPANPGTLVTNTIEIRFHALLVDHQFSTSIPVSTYNFAAKAPHLVLKDRVAIQESLVMDVPNLDIQGPITVGANQITPATFPSLVNLTNANTISSQAGVILGTTARPISYVQNNSAGTISGSVLDFFTTTLVDSGRLVSTVGDISLNSTTTKVTGGKVIATGNLIVVGKELELTNATLQAGYQARNPQTGNTNYFNGQLRLQVSDRLVDSGPTSSNGVTVYDGFHLLVKPTVADLLGTTITSKVARFSEAVHTWAGADLGPVPAGFSNNAALGQLVLDGREFSLFTFASPNGAPAALYVDYLVLTNNAANVDLALNISPEFTLYFADANVPASQLDGALGGRIRWVSGFAGGFSSSAVTLGSGRVVRVNRSLLSSETVDSDGDGIPNALDASPFEPESLRINVRLLSLAERKAEISWAGTPGSRYRVEYASGLSSGNWLSLADVQNAADAAGPVAVVDTPANSDEPRFYRVVELR